MEITQAQQYCSNLAQAHYENFPVGSRWISSKVRRDIHAIYAFARTADDFADEPEHEGHRLERLGVWRQLLQDAAAGKADHPVFVALKETIERHQIPIEWLDDLIQAFETDVRQNRHENFDSIVQYANKSANPIGRLVLWLHGYRDEQLFLWSDYICTALQFANFWQDISVDLKKNRIYLPQEDMRACGYSEADLKQGIVDDRFKKLVKIQLEKTWGLFQKGRPLCNGVRRDLKVELRLVWLGGTRILERIQKSQCDVFQKRPTLGKWDKVLLFSRMLGWSS